MLAAKGDTPHQHRKHKQPVPSNTGDSFMRLPQCHWFYHYRLYLLFEHQYRSTLCKVTLKCCHSNTQATPYITPASPHIFPPTTSTHPPTIHPSTHPPTIHPSTHHPPTIHPPIYLYLQCKCFPHPILQSTSVSPQYSGSVCIYSEMMSYQQALCVGLHWVHNFSTLSPHPTLHLSS